MDRPTGEGLNDLAEMVLWLLEHPREWIARRVEHYQLIDHCSMGRRITLEFELDPRVAGHPVEGKLSVIPLALLEKRPLRGFQLTTDSGRKLPSLITAESTQIAHRVLLVAARRAIGSAERAKTTAPQRVVGRLRQLFTTVELEDAVVQNLADIVGNNPDLTRSALLSIESAGSSDAQDRATAQRRDLAKDDSMMALVRDLASGFLLLTPRCVRPQERCIWEFTYDDVVVRDGLSPRWPFVRLGLMPERLTLPTPAAARAASFHCEVDAPPDLEIVRARLDRGARYVARASRFKLSLTRDGRRLRSVTATMNRNLEARDGGGIPRAHLHLPLPEQPVGGDASVVVELRMKRGGFLRPAFLTCLLASGLLIGGCHRLPALAENVEPATTLLLLVPGLLAAYLVRPGEHALAGLLLFGIRIMLLIAGLCSVVAGALLIARIDINDLRDWWIGLRDVAVLAAVAVGLACILPPSGKNYAAQT